MRRTLKDRLDRPLAAMLATAGLYLVYAAALLEVHNFDSSLLVMAGGKFCDWKAAPPALNVITELPGYDGQFYYRLALDPFTGKQTEYGITLDHPHYRQQRILYPLVVWLVTGGGRPELVAPAMLLVNYLALCATGWLGGAFAKAAGRHALWGMAFALYPGLLVTLSRDLAEIIEVCLVCAALHGQARGRPVLAGVALSLAVLAKETALLVAAGGGVAYLIGVWRGGRRPAPVTFLLPVFTFLVWQAWLHYHWPNNLAVDVRNNFGPPFAGVAWFVRRNAGCADHLQCVWFAEFCLFVAFVGAVAAVIRGSAAGLHVKIGWLLYAALIACLSPAVWFQETFLRASAELYALGLLILFHSPGRLARVVAAGVGVCWMLLAVEWLVVRGSWVPPPGMVVR